MTSTRLGGSRRGAAIMPFTLPPNEVLFALLLATILIALAAGVDLPPEDAG
jgi:hypothetical protein